MAAHQGKELGMTTERSTTLPPRWAESLLRMILPSKDCDSISGDLLEEYRESIPIGLITGAAGAIAGRTASAIVDGASRLNIKRG